jgi:hypothetical protein
MEVSPFWNFTDKPSSIARKPYNRVGKSSNSPTEVNTEPSMIPIGGTKKPPIIRPTDTKKQTENVMRDSSFVFGSSAFSLFRTLAIRLFIIFLFTGCNVQPFHISPIFLFWVYSNTKSHHRYPLVPVVANTNKLKFIHFKNPSLKLL